jgi:hypothetical protein
MTDNELDERVERITARLEERQNEQVRFIEEQRTMLDEFVRLIKESRSELVDGGAK